MWIKRGLLLLPLLIVVVLVQSYFWVPTFEDHLKGNPERLTRFIGAGIGDASILNPILSADTASSAINDKVFEGLLDLDENLNLRGRLAVSWTIYEEAFIETDNPLRLKEKIEAAEGELPASIVNMEVKGGKLKIRLNEVSCEFFAQLKKAFPLISEEQIIRHPVILFNLRRGVRWHDGKPFTSRDVKFTYEAIMNPQNRSPRTSDFEPVKSVEMINEWTVKVTYKRLFSPAIYSWMIGIIPQHLLSEEKLRDEAIERGKDPSSFTIRDSGFNRNPLGVGPFKFKEWKSDQHIRLIRNEDYWEGPPHFSEYVFRIIPDMLVQEMEFYAGALDNYSARAHQVVRLRKDERFQHFSGLSWGFTYIGYNMRREIFKDRRAREALTLAINIPEIIEHLLYGQAEPITGPFPKRSDYYHKEVQPRPYDPEEAARILKELGWTRNNEGWLEKEGQLFQFTLITNAGNPYREALLTIVQNFWRKLGIKVTTDRIEWSVFLERINKRDFDALILGWSLGINPDLYQIWHSSQAEPYKLNFVGFHNPRADELIIKIREEYDRKRQIEYTHELHRIIYEDQPYTFLYAGKWTALLDERIVLLETEDDREVISRIKATETGDYTYLFNRWIRLKEAPVFDEGL